MRKFLPILLLFSIALQAQHPQNIVREEIMVPMRDGVRLGAILYRPDRPRKFPALVYRTPYGIDDYDSYAEFPLKAAKEGYIVLLVDVRGRYRSEGEFVAYQNEKNDGYDVVEWVGTSPYCNGKVGTYGGSYPGIVQWLAMSQMPPHLAAAAPEMTPIGSHHFFYYGGAFSMTWLDWFVPYIFADKRKRAHDTSGTWDDAKADEEWAHGDKRKWYAYRPLIDLPILKKHAPEYYAWLQHPDKSPWWDFVKVEDVFKKFDIPVFLLSGWYDAGYGPEGASRAYRKMQEEAATETAKKNTRLVLGPWNHTSLNVRKTHFGEMEFYESAGLDYDTELLKWFDENVKGIPHRSNLPPVSIFVMGENKWLAENEWPLSRAVATDLYLQGTGKATLDKTDGKLAKSIPEQGQGDTFVFDPANPLWDKSYEKSYPYDQRDNEIRKDVLVYTSAPLASDLKVVGEVVAELFVSSTAKDTDFAITLTDVYPDGKSINLSGMDAGYLRMRYRNGFEKQELMKPGEVYKIRIGQLYTANLFKKGHRIRVQVTSSKAPHHDPNPNTGTEMATEKDLVPAANTVYHSRQYPSKIILPVIE
ncbi:MAG: CocE/NonD family hydrolase [Cyclobacteriaceae bacterium]|nr:CocE/NonD family hydrolase [Cyclobacteriaceae bacterium]MCB0499272.1 CocE/NonD family hydrolase [Cyclobacteriaceae bacterium]MCB9237888.1 CocE/NonD family hydrolase [Flammeovirgaceae bacterium]MCO5271961.1 CocE/NonD family hydrolase [Cyclobacteriaceae bacterium]MCW5902507.1 CocE/NonD family hydrolase [Cyclobacteriaceae bacterium]